MEWIVVLAFTIFITGLVVVAVIATSDHSSSTKPKQNRTLDSVPDISRYGTALAFARAGSGGPFGIAFGLLDAARRYWAVVGTWFPDQVRDDGSVLRPYNDAYWNAHLGGTTMHEFFDPQAPKRPANLSINSDLLAKCKAMNINLSATLERALVAELGKMETRKWKTRNRAAIRAYNDFVEEHGTFGDEYRAWWSIQDFVDLLGEAFGSLSANEIPIFSKGVETHNRNN